jgi:hypothetical protein
MERALFVNPPDCFQGVICEESATLLCLSESSAQVGEELARDTYSEEYCVTAVTIIQAHLEKISTPKFYFPPASSLL